MCSWTYGMKYHVALKEKSEVTQSCLTLCDHMVACHGCSLQVACQALPSMGFFRQEYWSGLLFPFPGDLPNPGIERRSPALQVGSLLSEPPGKPNTAKFSPKVVVLFHLSTGSE